MAILPNSEIGLMLYALGMGLLGGFMGNILAGWFNNVFPQPAENVKKMWIFIFILFAVAIVIVGVLSL
jgi:hypothetical protein